ncbi:MAG: hypothetical protein K9G58_00240 [Bacteroidales bacterium]|nr:hypothetical protein [Bacteroidales bacterium]MCF8386880.1 hypothetical protein [Bacteroidales bacterium]MCF8396567.1 hypothetical protein [Bacteroidales bacterium]
MKRTNFNHYKLIAKLFEYPSCSLQDALGHFRGITIYYPDIRPYIDAFKDHVTGKHTDTLKEFYIKTFDVQALCYLDIGYVLFGEDYMRGEFLVALQKEYRNASLGWGNELPDHLPNVLMLISESSKREFVREFSYSLLIPAIREMIRNFHSESNVYKGLLKMLLFILEEDFEGAPFEQYQIKTGVKSDFLDCIGCSMKKSKKSIKL